MWRSLFIAIGLYLMIVGMECLAVDRVDLKIHEEAPASAFSLGGAPQQGPAIQIIPAPWWPWSFLASGAVVCLYTFTIPRRVQGK
jgi:hypothetical protein